MADTLRLYSCDLVSKHGFGIDAPPDDLLGAVGLVQGDAESHARYDRIRSGWKDAVPGLVERYLLPELWRNGFTVEVEPALWMSHNCVQATRVNEILPDPDYGWRRIEIGRYLRPEFVEVPMEVVIAACEQAYLDRAEG